MNDKHPKKPEKIIDLKKKAKEIIKNSPLYIEDEPTVVGSPENLISNDENNEDEDKKDK